MRPVTAYSLLTVRCLTRTPTSYYAYSCCCLAVVYSIGLTLCVVYCPIFPPEAYVPYKRTHNGRGCALCARQYLLQQQNKRSMDTPC